MKLTSKIFLTLTLLLLFSATAAAQAAHSVWSDHPLAVTDWQTHIGYNTFIRGNAAMSWTEGTLSAYVRAVAVVTPQLRYEFILVRAVGTTAETINGLYDVKRNGILVCHNCVGKAYGLNQPATGSNYFKIYVGTPGGYAERWHYSGYITSRFDF
jgi:hypothetical protein